MATFAGRYKLVRKIGSGGFGQVYLAVDSDNNEEEVAVKLEPKATLTPMLLRESEVYKALDGFIGFPKARWFGEERKYNVLVMDLLGPSLEDLFEYCSRRFTIKTVLMLADQMILRMEAVHMKSFVHRDIKPANFLMGIGKSSNRVFLTDFGLATWFRNRLIHRRYEQDLPLIGTVDFASVNSHQGIRQSRRDDMESLGYIFMYFLKGSLPWQNLKAITRKQKLERISEKKMSTPVEVLCMRFPSEFEKYLNYCRNLRYEEAPEYSYLRSMFRVLFRCLNCKYDYKYDWLVQEEAPRADAANSAMVAVNPAVDATNLGVNTTNSGVDAASLGADATNLGVNDTNSGGDATNLGADATNPEVDATTKAAAGSSCPILNTGENCSKCPEQELTLQCPFKGKKHWNELISKEKLRTKPEGSTIKTQDDVTDNYPTRNIDLKNMTVYDALKLLGEAEEKRRRELLLSGNYWSRIFSKLKPLPGPDGTTSSRFK